MKKLIIQTHGPQKAFLERIHKGLVKENLCKVEIVSAFTGESSFDLALLPADLWQKKETKQSLLPFQDKIILFQQKSDDVLSFEDFYSHMPFRHNAHVQRHVRHGFGLNNQSHTDNRHLHINDFNSNDACRIFINLLYLDRHD